MCIVTSQEYIEKKLLLKYNILDKIIDKSSIIKIINLLY